MARPFEGLRVVTARLGRPASGDPLASAEIYCQKGGPRKSGLDCRECSRLAHYRLGPAAGEITIFCTWRSDERVDALMTRATALVEVEPETTLDAADELARASGVRHLPVFSHGALVGMLCRCDLAEPWPEGARVVSRMACPVVDVPPTASLGEALETMNRQRVGCLAVTGGSGLLGLITRGDLRRAGAPEEVLDTERCASCGGGHGVRTDPRYPSVLLCLDCLERAGERGLELGDGD
jgi:CBS domain-containing protein